MTADSCCLCCSWAFCYYCSVFCDRSTSLIHWNWLLSWVKYSCHLWSLSKSQPRSSYTVDCTLISLRFSLFLLPLLFRSSSGQWLIQPSSKWGTMGRPTDPMIICVILAESLWHTSVIWTRCMFSGLKIVGIAKHRRSWMIAYTIPLAAVAQIDRNRWRQWYAV